MWIEIEPRWRAPWGGGGDPYLAGIAPIRMTHARAPSNVEAPNVVIKLNIEIPDEAFKPLRPVIDIDVPADLVRASLPVTADEPGQLS